MAGLLRTTSRSESSNFFFQHYHDNGDTLVEFYSIFESAMDKQRLKTVNDENKSQQIPLTDTTMSIEMDASKVYTLELYYLNREEIKSACFHTIMADMMRDNESRHSKYKDELLHDQIFEVSIRHSDNDVQCNCKFYFHKGYLCRHAFVVLHQCGVEQILRAFVKPCWSKNAVRQHSFFGSSEFRANCDKKDITKLKRTRALFEFHNRIDYAGEDEDNLDLVLKSLQSLNDSLTQRTRTNLLNVGAQGADKFIGPVNNSEIIVQNPNISRNKGCGIWINSSREISIETRKNRKCGICNKFVGHNARICPMNKNPSVT